MRAGSEIVLPDGTCVRVDDGVGGCRLASGDDGGAAMIPVSAGVRIWLASGHTDMRRYAERRIMRSPRPLMR